MMKGMIMGVGLVMGSAELALAGEPADTKPWAATVQTGNVGTRGEKDMPPRIDPLPGPNVPLSPKERHGIRYGKEWANNRDVPARGEDGSIVFVFGSTLPTVVCAPLYVCDLALQTGESVNDLNVGDSVRWQITPATQGAGERLTTHVMIKPMDVGLLTNLVITTDRRAYTIKLISQRTEWMPRVSFFYPEDARSEWGAYRTRQEASREKAASAAPAESAAHLDFAYDISGDSPSWRPVRVYASGAKTYIQFPKGVAHGDLPALVALGDDGGIFTEPSKQLVNYRYVQGRFEVDKVLDRAALISGVGWDQTTVKISRRGRE
jgi:P-type conjugative transfer protein TrbG